MASHAPSDRAAAALLVEAGELWVVENLGPRGARYWTPPGGSVDPGETWETGLLREVREETGLRIRDAALAFTHEVGSVRVRTYVSTAFDRVGAPDDPDGVILDVRRLPIAEALHRVRETAPRAISRPLDAWFRRLGRADERFTFAPSIARDSGLSL